ncbi:MAG: saccharopine dehydrogenase NADP-binding domain-containing protein [Bacteroidetes bacterium]|nr:saccharopine dehydrogenase NADP-binding domain-containing protein [Bacteroidota bacterium]
MKLKTILVLGIGRSSHYLLDYLQQNAEKNNWKIIACDKNADDVISKTIGMQYISARAINIEDVFELKQAVVESDLVVSLLPPTLHFTVAKVCLELGKHLATASYISPEMQSLDSMAKEKKLIFINEVGLDPGIDHMSAMYLLTRLKNKGAEIISFESYCGGLIAEEDCIGNPWKYKFSWNPMNVILAGQGGNSRYKKDNVVHEISPDLVFEDSVELDLQGIGKLDAYPNRDSLSYIPKYNLHAAHTFIRGTLRRENFCKAWNILVKFGFTDNQEKVPAEIINWNKLVTWKTQKKQDELFSNWLISKKLITPILKEHFDFLESEQILDADTAAGKLLQLLQVKWHMSPKDKDEVLLWHRIQYVQNSVVKTLTSTLLVMGENESHTAMARTVGLPLALAVEAILTEKVKDYGVQAPISENWYNFILPALEAEGLRFTESDF